MDKKELQLVSYEQLRKLKNLGFDWDAKNYRCIVENKPIEECKDCKYNGNTDRCNYVSKNFRMGFPTIALALKWFRDEKGYQMSIKLDEECYDVNYDIDIFIHDEDEDDDEVFWSSVMCSYTPPKSYEKAEITLLDVLIGMELAKLPDTIIKFNKEVSDE